MGDLSRLGQKLEEAVKRQGQILPTENENYGYFGTMRNGEFEFAGTDLQSLTEVWSTTFDLVLTLVPSASPAAVREFLDSGHGRHFADNVRDELGTGPLTRAKLVRAIRRAAAGRDMEKVVLQFETLSSLSGSMQGLGTAMERVNRAWEEMQSQDKKKNWKQRDDAAHDLAEAADNLLTAARAWQAQRR